MASLDEDTGFGLTHSGEPEFAEHLRIWYEAIAETVVEPQA